jgi:hypothetical protein
MKNSSNQMFLGIWFFICVVLFVTCSANKSQQEKQAVEKTTELKSVGKNSLFDGETLDGWQITEFGPQGPVLVSEGKIVLNYGDGCTGITWQREFPKVNYEVTLEAQKTSGNDFFCGMTFPVNDEFCSLIVGGWGGPVVGLSCIDGKDAANNETKILKRFDKNVWYNIKLQVTNEKITAWIDDEKLVDFAYPGHELYTRPEVNLSKPFGICSYNTTAELRKIRLVEL